MMLLTIHGLPMSTTYQDLKVLLKQKCSINDFNLDYMTAEGDGMKKVRIGLTDEREGAYVIKRLNGFRTFGGQLLRVEPVGNPTPINAPNQNNYNDPPGNYPPGSSYPSNSVPGYGSQSMSHMGGRPDPMGSKPESMSPLNLFSRRPDPMVGQPDTMGGRPNPMAGRTESWGSANNQRSSGQPMSSQPNYNQQPLPAIEQSDGQQVVSDKPQTFVKPSPAPYDKSYTIDRKYLDPDKRRALANAGIEPRHIHDSIGKERPGPRFSPRRDSHVRRMSPGRGMSPSGSRMSPSGRRMSPSARRMSPSGRRMSPSVRRLSPGRRAPSPGRRLSPTDRRTRGRRETPPHRMGSPPRGRKRPSPDRRPSPGRRGSPGRRDSPPRAKRFSPTRRRLDKPAGKYAADSHNVKDVRTAYEPPTQATNQAMYAGGYRPSIHQNVQYPISGVRPQEQRSSSWQQYRDKAPFSDSLKKDDTRRDITRIPKFAPRIDDVMDSKRSRSPHRKSRSPIRRDRSRSRRGLRDRFKKHSPSPRSPRRSWALEKRRSPNTAPPGPSRDEQYRNRPFSDRDADDKGKRMPVWERKPQFDDKNDRHDRRPEVEPREFASEGLVRVRTDLALRQQIPQPSHRELSPRVPGFNPDERFSQREPKFETREDFADYRRSEAIPEQKPCDRSDFKDIKKSGVEEHRPGDLMLGRHQDTRGQLSRQIKIISIDQLLFEIEFLEIYKSAVEFNKNTQELRTDEDQRRDENPEERSRSEIDRNDIKGYDRAKLTREEVPPQRDVHDESRSDFRLEKIRRADFSKEDSDWQIELDRRRAMSQGIRAKRERAVEEIAQKIMHKHGQKIPVALTRRLIDELKITITRIIRDMFGSEDVSFIEMVVKFHAKFDAQDEAKMFSDVMASYSNQVRSNKRPVEEPVRASEVPAKSARQSIDAPVKRGAYPTQSPVKERPAYVESSKQVYNIAKHDRTGGKLVMDAAKPVMNTVKSSSQAEIPLCAFCGQGHTVCNCPQFSALAVSARKTWTRTAAMCFRCLGEHFRKDCTARDGCKHCRSEVHHSLLCQVASVKGAYPTPSPVKERPAYVESSKHVYNIAKHDRTGGKLVMDAAKPVMNTVESSSQIEIPRCAYCGQGHAMYNCPQFTALVISARKTWTRKSGMCFRCLREHFWFDCTAQNCCKHCRSEAHHSLLCTQVALTVKAGVTAAVEKKKVAIPSVEPTPDERYELNPLMMRMLYTELQNIKFKVCLPDDPPSQAEKFVAFKFRRQALVDLRKVLGLNVTKRLLNIHNPLYVKLSFSKTPEGKHLKYMFSKYNCVGYKQLKNTSPPVLVVLSRSITDFDRICSAKTLTCGNATVTITPVYKFAQCPPELRTPFNVKNTGGNENETKVTPDTPKVTAKPVETNVVATKTAITQVPVTPNTPKITDKKSVVITITAAAHLYRNLPKVTSDTSNATIQKESPGKPFVKATPNTPKVTEEKIVSANKTVQATKATTNFAKGTQQKLVNKPIVTQVSTVKVSTQNTKVGASAKKENVNTPKATIKTNTVTKTVNATKNKDVPKITQKKNIKTDNNNDYDELDDHDILALISEGIVSDECSESDEE